MYDDISELASVLVLVGLTIFLIIFYLTRQTKLLKNSIIGLYQLNHQLKFDVLCFIEHAWVILEKSGFANVSGQIVWYGETKNIALGKLGKGKVFKEIKIEEGDISVQLSLQFKEKVTGEKKLIADIIYRTYATLVFSNVVNKNMQFVLSKQRLERFQLFVQHDVKNIAQFISLLNHQVAQAETVESKIKLIDRLKTLLPSQTEKANKVIECMKVGKVKFDDIEQLNLKTLLLDCAETKELHLLVEGEASTFLSKLMLQQVFSELLDNFKVHTLSSKKTNCIRAKISTVEHQIFIRLSAEVNQQLIIFPERLFEPFWTTSESGMGLGMFIVREMLKQMAGKIDFQQTDNQIIFNLTLPKNNYETLNKSFNY